MVKTLYVVALFPHFYKNRILELHEDYQGFEDRLYPDRTYPFYLMRQELEKQGFKVKTYDYFDKDNKEPYALFFVDTPPDLESYAKKHPGVDMYLHHYESPLYSFRNMDSEKQKHFKKIFTWDSRLEDGKKFITVRYANRIPKTPTWKEKKEHLCLMVSSHKLKTEPGELYSERVAMIEWFEKNAPSDFNLYGRGWDQFYFKDRWVKLNHLKFLTKLLRPYHPSYRGPAADKLELCRNHKFYICYENTVHHDYISEKIFDTFIAGSVPIYWGAPNIAEHIPANTFIDRTKFSSNEELYQYMKNMPDQEYQGYLAAIREYMQSEKVYPFTGECFAKTITQEILKP